MPVAVEKGVARKRRLVSEYCSAEELLARDTGSHRCHSAKRAIMSWAGHRLLAHAAAVACTPTITQLRLSTS